MLQPGGELPSQPMRVSLWKVVLAISMLLGAAPVAIPAVAQSSDSPCFIRDSSGRLIDLSQSVCGYSRPQPVTSPLSPPVGSTLPPPSQPMAPEAAGNLDDRFWETFSSAINDPQVLNTVQIVGRSGTISLGQEVCQTLAAGGTLPDPEQKSQESRYPAAYFAAINTAAVNTYCPQYKPKPSPSI
ncbi:hypothetical protein DO97_00300 [Neosynechococcus sphagnicola sy1]|uniref:DUF732 domain-containing protein n=2 Tax=Neosynechococcus TaxID=1501143 RepID=A0A098TNU6_9CYAN|nr:hypothetical protein DO97_00300 [Neosynechococcus sphagnicola sy1]